METSSSHWLQLKPTTPGKRSRVDDRHHWAACGCLNRGKPTLLALPPPTSNDHVMMDSFTDNNEARIQEQKQKRNNNRNKKKALKAKQY
jgi:hypothetical protein